MSSEHAIEQVPLSAIREGDMLQDPKSGNWIKVTRTSDGPTRTPECSDGVTTVIEAYRVYYGDGGEEIDSRLVTGLVNRQVRE
jgi:hypothetical protein